MRFIVKIRKFVEVQTIFFLFVRYLIMTENTRILLIIIVVIISVIKVLDFGEEGYPIVMKDVHIFLLI